MTSDRANIPMWAYYAGVHTGVCIHLDATIAPFGNAFKVNYQEDYPYLPQPLVGLPPYAVIEKCLLIKSKAWEHESEYRIIDMPKGDGSSGRTLDPPIAQHLTTQLVRFHQRPVLGVSCGALMKDDAIERLLRICKDRIPPLPVWRGRIAKYRFDLAFKEVHG